MEGAQLLVALMVALLLALLVALWAALVVRVRPRVSTVALWFVCCGEERLLLWPRSAVWLSSCWVMVVGGPASVLFRGRIYVAPMMTCLSTALAVFLASLSLALVLVQAGRLCPRCCWRLAFVVVLTGQLLPLFCC